MENNYTFITLGYTKEEWDNLSDFDKEIIEEIYYKKY